METIAAFTGKNVCNRSCLIPVLLLAFSALAHAQTYPAKTVRVIVPFPPGGSTDILARAMGLKLAEAWGQQVIVDNRPGAAGVVGVEAVVRAAPNRPISEVDAWAWSLRQTIEGQAATPGDLDSLYRWSHEYFVRQRRLHRFPGAYLVKAFNLAINGLHYHLVMNGITRESRR